MDNSYEPGDEVVKDAPWQAWTDREPRYGKGRVSGGRTFMVVGGPLEGLTLTVTRCGR